MARSVAKVKVTIWQSSEWRKLPPLAQWLYATVLLTQSTLNLAGCLAYMPQRWAALAEGMSTEEVEWLADILERAGYIVVDHQTGEVVIRTFTTHDLADGNLNKNLVKGFWSAWDSILSADLRHLVVVNLPERVWAWKDAEIPDEAKRLRTSPRSEPTVPTDGCNGMPSPVATPASFSSSASSTAAEPVLTVDAKLTAAARMLATAECDRRGTDIGNPDGYIESRIPPIRRQHEDAWRSLLDADPTTTPAQLATPPAQVSKRPEWVQAEESTAAASEKRYEHTAAVMAGEVCDLCRGTKRYLPDDSDTMTSCPNCVSAADEARRILAARAAAELDGSTSSGVTAQ